MFGRLWGKFVAESKVRKRRCAARPSHTLAAVCILCLAMGTIAVGTAGAQKYSALPGLKFFCDGKPITLGTARQDAVDIVVPLMEATTALTGGQGKLSSVRPGASSAQIAFAGAAIPVPIENPDGPDAAGDSRTPDPAFWATLKPGQPSVLLINLYSLTALLGVTVVKNGANVYLTTPAGWCHALGLPDKADAARRAVAALRPELGVSPPAKTVLLWARPPQPGCFVQLYSLGFSKAGLFPAQKPPQPLLGRNNLGKLTTFPRKGQSKPESWSAGPDEPVRFEAEFYQNEPALADSLGEDGKNADFADYALVTTTQTPASGDVLTDIRNGAIPAGAWSVVGVRQRVGRAFVLYDTVFVQPGDTPASLANAHGMIVPQLLSLNGLRRGDKLPEGSPIRIVKTMDAASLAALRKIEELPEPSLDPQPIPAPPNNGGLQMVNYTPYTVADGETLTEIAKKTNVRLSDLRRVNNLAPGEEPEGGDILNLPPPRPKKAAPTMPDKPPYKPKFDWKSPADPNAVFVVESALRKLMDSPIIKRFPAGVKVHIYQQERIQKISVVGIYYQGMEYSGYVRTRDLGKDNGNTAPPPAQYTPRPGGPPIPPAAPRPAFSPQFALQPGSPQGQAIVREALRWVGVPRYAWGGNEIGRGIDCSHFVATVFARVGVPCPSPPVHTMETYGDLVDWKGGVAEDQGKLRVFPPSPNGAYLRPGDRVIFQVAPSSRREGNHHIGIYVGRYGNIAHAVIHCNSRYNTVSVNDISTLMGIYRFSVRGFKPRPPGQFRQTAQEPDSGQRTADKRKEAAK